MFLHLGADEIVRLSGVVAILDIKVARAAATKEYLQLTRSENRLHDVSDGDAKSFVITLDGVFLSPISSVTLKKRAAFVRGLAE
ncbi:MAG: extracellular matrix regulator RemB [Bacillota bacterium]